jgi:hypothetical protein
MKKNWKKCAAILIFLSVASLSYGEQFYGLGLGVNLFTDEFPDDYTRREVGLGTIASYYFFPGNFFLGFFAKFSFGGSFLGKEHNGREEMDARKSNVFDFRMALAPSFRLKLGSKFQIPLSLGPCMVFTNEETMQKLPAGSINNPNDTTKVHNYKSISHGINGDLAALIIPGKHFYLKPGVSFDYLFLRSEKGEMWMNYRTTHNSRYKRVPYSTFNFGINLGLGMKF